MFYDCQTDENLQNKHDLAIDNEDISTSIRPDEVKEVVVTELSNQRVTYLSTSLFQ